MRHGAIRHLLILASVISIAACATTMHGTTQTVSVKSTPPGAVVKIDGSVVGTTPAFVELTRGEQHNLRIEEEGFIPYETTITHSMNGWILGNVILGGVVGIIVDSSSGAVYSLDQEEIAVELQKAGESQQVSSNGVYIIVASSHPAGLKEIADLRKA
jgi:PEGA domain-containing protein